MLQAGNSGFFEKLKTAPENRKTAPEKLQNEGCQKHVLSPERKILFSSPGLHVVHTESHTLAFASFTLIHQSMNYLFISFPAI